MADDCIFCKIRTGEIESEVLYQDDTCFVVRDIAPGAPVHMLVIPNRHFTYLTNLTPAYYSMIGGMFKAAEETARREGVAESGYRLVVNQGKDSGQQVPHLHLHLLGGERLGGIA